MSFKIRQGNQWIECAGGTVDLSNYIQKLGNEEVSGEPYHFGYYFYLTPSASQIIVTEKTITLDNNKTITDYSLTIQGATTTQAGLMTAADKIKLDSIDLTTYYTKTETDSLLNAKQDLIDSTHKLSYNLLSDTPTIPTKTSELTNDSGFLTSSSLSGYVKTSGDQDISGFKRFSSSLIAPALIPSGDNGSLTLYGGNNGLSGILKMYGRNYTDKPGWFELGASIGGVDYSSILTGKPDGSLIWDIQGTTHNVLLDGTAQTITGAKTFTQPIIQQRTTAQFAGVTGTTTELDLRVHTGTSNISQVQLYANGDAKLIAGDGTNRKDLVANSSGTLTWNSKYLSGLSTNVELNDLLPMEKEAGTDTTNTNRVRLFQNQWSISAGTSKSITVGRTGMIFFKRGSNAYCGFWTTWDTTLTELVNTVGTGTFGVTYSSSTNKLTVTNNSSSDTASMVGIVITTN